MYTDTRAAEAVSTGCSADELKVLPYSLEPQKSKFFSVAMKWVDRDIHPRSLACVICLYMRDMLSCSISIHVSCLLRCGFDESVLWAS